MRHLASCSLVASILLLTACGGRNEPDFNTPNRDGGADAGVVDGGGGQDAGPLDAGPIDAGSQDAGGGQDAGTQDAGGGDDGGITLPPMRAVITLTDVPQANVATVEALITDRFDPPPAVGCTNAPYDPDAVDTTPGFDAGTITVGGLDGNAVVLQPTTGGPYGVRYSASGSVPQPLFRDGNILTANASGGADLGAFAINMATPLAMELTAPTAGATVTNHSASQPLPVRWNPGGGDMVVITITPADVFFQPQSGTMAVCVTTDSGSFDVPANVLDPVKDGAILGQNTFLGVTRSVSGIGLLSGGSQVVLWAARAEGAAVKLQ